MSSGDPQRLLVIEDDPETRYLLTAVLAGEGREIVAAANGTEAERHLRAGGIDLVILDLILPDVDGRSLLSQLRERADTATVQVVVVTARGGPESRQDCYALGADAFVEKPFDPEELAANVSVRLGHAARAREAALSDALTGVLNKAGLQAKHASVTEKYGLALIELDDVGAHAEKWGWDKAERVVQEVARALSAALPEGASLARIGGGEFVLLLTGPSADAVVDVAGKVLITIKGVGSPELGVQAGELTATIGVVLSEPGTPLDEALDVGRRRLFQAREHAGDRVVADDSEAGSAGGRVLVAEDDEISASILVHKLKKEGLDVTRFNNGQEAYESAMAEAPDLVILDVKMPGLDGFEVLERLRRSPRLAGTPIVMLTSMGQEADVVRGFGLGADDYVLKPFSPVELTARIRRLLRRGRARGRR